MLHLLDWLWDVVVEPIFQSIGLLSRGSADKLPIVYWITSDLMSSMPFHAAGRSSMGSTDHVFNYAVPYYAVSAKTLVWSLNCFKTHRLK